MRTINQSGSAIDTRGAFFQSLGSNGRSCASCHTLDSALGLSVAEIQRRFASTRGKDPLFTPIDGANCPEDAQGVADNHSLLLRHGLIRVGLAIPANAEFTITAVHDPYGCAIAPDPSTGLPTVSVYRRPLPATNLRFLSTVMWDGRETLAPLTSDSTLAANLFTDLAQQATDAVLGHEQAAVAPSTAQVKSMVNFELGLTSAQVFSFSVGSLDAAGALGGPRALSRQGYYPGINDVLGDGFNPTSMTLYAAWQSKHHAAAPRADIAAGEQLFDSAPMTITDARGLNDNPAFGTPSSLTATCSSCHDAPNVGDHSAPVPIDIGIAHPSLPGFEADANVVAGLAELTAPELPVYRIDGCPDAFNPGQAATIYTTDPGRALITGKCADVERFKGPVLRGLSARAPYFHNGSAATLRQVVRFYDMRFQMQLTPRQIDQLAAFLATL
ncbi:MAG TPA: hypothetical protein VN660_06720 [Steroidobacteraceae bacterium]|nr:hypothetical protein [Steroidobacteraceae bacterium]